MISKEFAALQAALLSEQVNTRAYTIALDKLVTWAGEHTGRQMTEYEVEWANEESKLYSSIGQKLDKLPLINYVDHNDYYGTYARFHKVRSSIITYLSQHRSELTKISKTELNKLFR